MSEIKEYQIAIVGAGPAGLTAAIYTARAGFSTIVIGNPYESQVAKLGLIENYSGFAKGVEGLELMEAMEHQTKANGAEVIYDNVIEIVKKDKDFIIKTDDDETLKAKAIILTMGARHRKMRIPGEEEYYMKGVSYCSVCDGALYQGKPAVVIGYGNGAAKSALYMANLSSKVYLICTKKELGADAIYESRLKGKENLEIHYSSRVTKIAGNEFVTSVTYKESGKESDIRTEGVFIEYGSVPNTLLANQLGIEVDDQGFIVTKLETLETNIPGVYAAGDVCGRIKQIATAVGDGCIAATNAQNYVEQL
ncbi:MAG: FAD-dependent oxidoreductase [Candidatus Heimdallarchaeota archaeon]|nr:FAD-dependent oxidoreductase [Candidatus Heimdallarchaeota archaeon]MCK5297466.1 FAD-dependent oxidoreductase [Candidatus Heimdallarchaeota archaeon]